MPWRYLDVYVTKGVSMDKLKSKKYFIVVTFIILVGASLLLIKWNEERFAKIRLHRVEEIVVMRVFDGEGRFSYVEGFEEVSITKEEELKEFRKLLYFTDTKGRWFDVGDVLGWEYAFAIKVYYEDGYVEEIFCRDNDTIAKRLDYEDSYALGADNEVYAYCYDLFFDAPHPYLPTK